MAAFATDRRAGWVRVLVLIMCALFIFAVLAAPPAYAVGETVALFTAAAVLSSAVAALGFKLTTDAEGQATLSKMVEDFAKVSWATGLVIVGSRVNGLINGLNYIMMAVHNGKTYLDERVIAWCQQWLGQNGVYDSGALTPDISSATSLLNRRLTSDIPDSTINLDAPTISYNSLMDYFGLDSLPVSESTYNSNKCFLGLREYGGTAYEFCYSTSWVTLTSAIYNYGGTNREWLTFSVGSRSGYVTRDSGKTWTYDRNYQPLLYPLDDSGIICGLTNWLLYSTVANSTGLSGTDTIGEDYKDSTLDQILAGLKEWAQDWYDAGADSATNEASGALDLPLTVTDGAATANPALNPDVVYNPPFALPWPDVRSGETSSSTTEAGQANADAAQTATSDVAENQTIVDSLVTWALGYISPDTGLFSKFPLCIPYDAYLIVCSALGVDAVDASTVYGAEPGDLVGVVTSGTSTYSDFQPIIHLEHDFELDGRTYPLEITIDLTPWQPLVDLAREGIAILFMAELIASEYRRIKGH